MALTDDMVGTVKDTFKGSLLALLGAFVAYMLIKGWQKATK